MTTRRLSQSSGSWSKYFHTFYTCSLLFKYALLLLYFVCHSSRVNATNYVEQYLSNPDICAPVRKIPSIGFLFKEKIRLANFPNNTFVVKLSRWQERNPASAHLSFRCTFEVTAPKNHGIMMTIRSLYLRRYASQASCIDYLKFKPERSSSYSPHVCGEVKSSDKNEEPNMLIGPRYIYDPHAGLDVEITTDDASPNDSQKPLQIELVFTATRACSINLLRTGKLKQCTIKTPNSCIPADLFCDGYTNCGIEGDFGDDEKDCAEKPETVSRAMSIFIFGMTALGTLVTVAVVILLICCCFRRCTKKANSATSSDVEQQAELRNPIQDFEIATILQRPSTPTAPPDGTELSEYRSPSPKAEVGDEDLPPAYKDLFPNTGTITR